MREKEIENFRREYQKFFDPDRLYQNLALAALYLATFEVLKTVIIRDLKAFFSRGTEDVMKETPEGYKEEMAPYIKKYSDKRDKEFLGCCDWLLYMGAITSEEVQLLNDIKQQRNDIAHELPTLLFEPQRNVDITLLTQAKEMIRKIDIWWAMNVHIPINADLYEEPVKESEVQSGKDMFLNVIFTAFAKHFK